MSLPETKSWKMRNHYVVSLAVVKIARTYEVTPCSDMGEDSRSLSFIVISTETINQIMVIQHVYPDDQQRTRASSTFDLHWDRRVGTTESVTSEDLAVVVEAVISLSFAAGQSGGHTRNGRYSFSVSSAFTSCVVESPCVMEHTISSVKTNPIFFSLVGALIHPIRQLSLWQGGW
jgi:hypothetical protein